MRIQTTRILLAISLLSMAAGMVSAADVPTTAPTGPARIVSLVPQATEALFAVGAEDRIVGVSTSSLWPPEARDKPQVGGILDPQIEQIMALDPDLVIVSRNHILHNRALRERGIETLVVSTRSIDEALRMIGDLGIMIGKREEVRVLLDTIVEPLNALYAQYENVSPRRVLVSVIHEKGAFREVLALGPDNYIDEVVRTAGGINAVTQPEPLGGLTVKLNTLQVRMMRPDVVIDMQGSEPSDEERAALMAYWRELLGEETDIHIVHDEYIGVPGVRMAETVARMGRWIHGPTTRPAMTQPATASAAPPAH